MPASGGFTKLGNGVLQLSGINTFTGGMNVNAGAVLVSSTTAIGGATNIVTLNNNAALWLNTATVGAGGNTIAIGASGGTIASVGGDRALSSPITLTGALSVSLADPASNSTDRSVTLSSAITGSGSLVVSGNLNNVTSTAKVLSLSSAANTYSGGSTINSGGVLQPTGSATIGSSSGSLTINTGGTLDLNNTSQTIGNLTGTGGRIVNNSGAALRTLTIGIGNSGGGNYAGTIANNNSGTGTLALFKTGTGTITLSGSNTYSGGTTVDNGTLALDFTTATTAAPVLATTGALTLAGGTVDLRNGTAQVQALASTTLGSGPSNVTRSSGTSVLRMNTITPGLGLINFGAGGIASTTNVNNSAGILGAWATVGASNWAAAGAVEGGGNSYITAYSGAFADVDRLGGTISSSATSNVRIIENGGGTEVTPAAIGVTDIATLLQSASGGPATYNPGTTDILRLGASGGILLPGTAGALTIGATANDGKLSAGGDVLNGAGSIVLTNNHATHLITINSIIEDNGSGAVSLTTAGNVLLTGANTYSGPTTASSGTLEVSGSSTSSGLYNTLSGATLIFGGGTHDLNAGASLIGSGLVQIASGALNFAGNVSLTGANVLAVSGGMFNVNTGATVTSLAGGLSIGGGTLNVNTPLSLSVPVTFSSGTQGGTSTLTLSSLNWSAGTMSDSGSTDIAPGGSATLSGSGDKVFNARTLNNAGAVTWTGTGNIRGVTTTATINNLAGGIVDAQSDASLSISSGSGHTFNNAGIFKKSAGSLTTTVGWAFNNSGTVEVQSGMLNLSGGVAQLSGGTLSGGTWKVGNGATLAITTGTNIITNAGNVVLSGLTSTFSEINSLAANSGGFTIDSGRNFSTLGSLANSGTLTIGTGSTLNVNGDLSGAGVLNLTIGGAPSQSSLWSRIIVGAKAFVDGAVNMVVNTGSSTIGSVWKFLTSSPAPAAQPSIVGTFDQANIVASNLPAGTGLLVRQTQSSVELELKSVGLTYAAWVAPEPFSNGDDAATNADPDHDGISNLMEYALGTDPLRSDGEFLPSVTVVNFSGSNYLTLTYARPADPYRPTDLLYEVQRSTNLAGWSTAGLIEVSVTGTPGTGLETVVVRSATALGTPGVTREFLRLSVSQIP